MPQQNHQVITRLNMVSVKNPELQEPGSLILESIDHLWKLSTLKAV